MLQITPKHKIFISVAAIDFRKGIDGIIGVCKNKLKEDPFSGHLFLFINKKRNCIKFLAYDSQGFWLCTKRLSSGKFNWWPKIEQDVSCLNAQQAITLMYNGNPELPDFGPNWLPVT